MAVSSFPRRRRNRLACGRVAARFLGNSIWWVKSTPPPQSKNPVFTPENEREAIEILVSFFDGEDSTTCSKRKGSAIAYKMAYAALARYKESRLNPALPKEPAERPGIPLNLAYAYASFGGPYLKRP